MRKEKIAEFIGILLGDGCIGKYRTHVNGRKKIQYRVKISLNSVDDREYVYYVKHLMDQILLVNSLMKKRIGENTLDVVTYRKHAFDYLIKNIGMKFSPKWNRALIPLEFESQKFGLWVLRGYCDTDGSLVLANNNGLLYPRIEMKVSPSPMINQFAAILNNTGIRYNIYQIGKGKVRFQINGIKSVLEWDRIIGFSNMKHKLKLYSFMKIDENKMAVVSTTAR